MRGYGYTPHFVEGDDPARMHQHLARTLDVVVEEIEAVQADARKLEQDAQARVAKIAS
jgi:xylulose-5-phosphate/fructose-6-phosphate phosphoketolase